MVNKLSFLVNPSYLILHHQNHSTPHKLILKSYLKHSKFIIQAILLKAFNFTN